MNALPRKWLLVGIVSIVALIAVVAVATALAMTTGAIQLDELPIKAGMGWGALFDTNGMGWG